MKHSATPVAALVHVPALDGIRAIAVLMVLVTHFWSDPPGWTILNRFASFGWAGVDLFFVLSGYLITRILWNTRHDAHYYVNFYGRRTLRIFPLYYAVMAIILLGLPLVTTLPEQLMADRWMYFAYLSNVALAAGGWQLFLSDITWSLAVEEQFYLIWPSVVRALNYRRLLIGCAILLVLAPLSRWYFWDDLGWRWLHMATPFRLDAFAVGAIVGLVAIPRALALSVFTAGATLLALLVGFGLFARDSWNVQTFGHTLTVVTAGAAIRLALDASWLQAWPLREIGKISYGMYLWHPLCLAATSVAVALVGFNLERLSGVPILDAVLQTVATTVAVMIVSALSFWLLEQPFLKMKARFQ